MTACSRPGQVCHDTETARAITHSPSTWHNHVIVVSGAKPGTKWNGDDRGTQTSCKYAGDRPRMQSYNQRNFEDGAPRHRQPVKCVAQCWRDDGRPVGRQ